MTRQKAQQTIYQIINSGIIDMDLENELNEIANHICDDKWEKCENDPQWKYNYPNYCEGCKNLK